MKMYFPQVPLCGDHDWVVEGQLPKTRHLNTWYSLPKKTYSILFATKRQKIYIVCPQDYYFLQKDVITISLNIGAIKVLYLYTIMVSKLYKAIPAHTFAKSSSLNKIGQDFYFVF